jgi:potassium-transporting ATPase potassium-binding subunit
MALDIVGVLLTLLFVAIGAWFLGGYMARVFGGERVLLSRVLRPVERGIYRVCGIDEDKEHSWKGYLAGVLVISAISLLFTFVVLLIQDRLPLNPQHLPAVKGDLAFNTATSFTSNTNWQNYSGETTMSYLSQMLALALHNFLSAAVGMVIAIALIRALVRRSAGTIGNFHVDVVRCILYVLLPLSIAGTLVLVSQGAVQNFNAYTPARTLSGVVQSIAQGPVASQELIKDLGTNGGGFFNANSAHPFENPNGFTNQFEIFLELLIPFALAVTFGRMVGNLKQGLAVAGAMAVVMIGIGALMLQQEQAGNPALAHIGVTQARTDQQSGGNMEGKSVRNGPLYSAMFADTTTSTSTGSVDAAHDSLTPLGGLGALVNIELGEITPGGVGSGMYGMLVFAILAVFIAGLMVGRTPEYLGKKIESRDVKLAALAILTLPASILGFTAVAVLTGAGQAGPLNHGAHGFTEILYAFSSTTGNNGSAFAGLSGNTLFYNGTLAAAMLVGRFVFIVPVLALAGSLVRKQAVAASAGTFPTDTGLFTGLLVGVIVIVGALTFFPALSLGPILEHLQLNAGHLAH